MNTEELLVHDGCKRKAVERLHTTIVDCFRIFDFTCECVCVCVSSVIPTCYTGCLHSSLKVKYSVRCLHSWFPLSKKMVLG